MQEEKKKSNEENNKSQTYPLGGIRHVLLMDAVELARVS